MTDYSGIGLDDFENWADREKSLLNALHAAQRDLDKAKRSNEDYHETLREAVRDAFVGLELQPIPEPKKDKRKGSEEVAVALLSDTQLGKVTAHGPTIEYTTDKAVERVRLYGQKIVELTEIQRTSRPIRKCVVPLLGDIVEGIDIFPGQIHLIDSGLYRQIVRSSEMLVDFFRYLLKHFDEVHAYGIIGNHGRIMRRGVSDPETNMDRLVYWITQLAMKDEPRIKWTIPEGSYDRNWYGIIEVGNWSALGIHGDQIRGHSGFPWYGLGKKVNGWASGAIPERFDDVLMGHWHQLARIPLNKRAVYVNGSTEHYNTYAAENLAAMSDPAQWLLFVDPEKGRVTTHYGVDLTDV